MQRRRRDNTGAILLLLEIFNIGTQYIPPVTLFLTFVNLLVYMDLFSQFPDIDKSCCNYFDIVEMGQFFRLFLCSVTHADDWHLYYNMVSFIWKGINLEPRIGSKRMAVLVIMFSFLTNLLTIVVYQLIFLITGIDSYRYVCCVGFSAIIFALKVVIQSEQRSYDGSRFQLMGNLGILGEIFLLWLLAPGSSFIGHLSGIFIGYLYASGPLKSFEIRVSGLIPQFH